MPRLNHHPHAGSDPETRFDHWLDAFVTGTPGSDASRHGDPSGQLATAQSGARQLHDLAAQSAMTSGAIPARQRIKEQMMHSGTLAAPESGGAWIPARRQERRVPWWSPASPVIAGALIFAVILALVGTLFWLQRPNPSPTPTGAPGFAASSPGATPSTTEEPSDLFIVSGGTETIDTETAIGTLDDDGLTLPNADGEPVTIPNVVNIRDIGIPDRAVIHQSDGSGRRFNPDIGDYQSNGTRAVIDLATGKILFNLPGFPSGEGWFSPYLFSPTDHELTDWTITDLATGDIRLLSNVVDLPDGASVMPSSIDLTDIVGDARVFNVEIGEIDGVDFNTIDPATRTFVIAGSLDRAVPLPDFPTARQTVGTPLLVMSPDGATVAYETRAGEDRIVLLDTATGRVLTRFGASTVGDAPALAGFTGDGRLVITTPERILALDWSDSDEPVTVIADGFENIDNPLLYAPAGLAYVPQVDALLQVDLATGEVREVTTDLVPGSFDFTRPGSGWITFLTQDGQTLIDARTGEVAAQMESPGETLSITDWGGLRPAWIDGEGDTFISATERSPSPMTYWLLSPEFPDGLELTAPEGTGNYEVWLSRDGSTFYALGRDGLSSGPGNLWMTPISGDPDWQLLAEDVVVEGYFPLDQAD